MDMEDILREAEKYKERLEGELKNTIPSEGIKNFHDAMHYHLSTGGKRLRPILALLTARALGVDEEKVMPFAVACELLHNWLLIHDDIEDGDTVRRGKPAVWVKYGLAHGVNVGDGMAHYAIKSVLRCYEKGVPAETVFRLLEVYADTAIKTAEGQALEINLRNNDHPTEEEYMRMVTGKTAYYLTIPMVGAAVIAGMDDNFVNRIVEYGKCVGPAFQIRDDVIDLTEGKGRDDIGNDIKEGKRSILVVYALEAASEEEKNKLIEILNKPREETTREDVLWVVELFRKTGAIERANQKAEELVNKAKEVISPLPDQLKEILEAMADYMIKRKT